MVLKNKNFLLNENSNFLFSFILYKLISQLMKNGKRVSSEKIVKNILLKISLKGFSPVHVIILAVNTSTSFKEILIKEDSLS